MVQLKILFADDDARYAALLKRFRDGEGYSVTYVGDGLSRR